MVRAGLRNGYLLLLFLFFSFVQNGIILAGNDFVARAADRLFSGGRLSFSGIAAPVLWLVALGAVSAFCRSLSGKHYSAEVQREVRESLGRHLLRLPFSYFDEKGTGSTVTRMISDLEETGRFFSEILPGLLVNAVTVATATVYLVRMDVSLAVASLAAYPVMLAVADRLSKRLAELTKRLRTHTERRTQLAYDAVWGIAVGRSFNLYEMQEREMDAVIDKTVNQACRSTRISSLGWVLKNVITAVPVLFCHLFALHETLLGRITVGQMLAFTVILDRVRNPLGDMVFCANEIREAGVSLRRIQEIFARQEERTGGGIVSPEPGMQAGGKTPVIEWQDVEFSYDGSGDRPVLNKVSFTVTAGEQTAFVGGSGEGKSTIFKLLCGFYERSGGRYLLFGHPFEEWNLEAARSCFSEVSQNVFLFPGTIRQNVACGKENATQEEIEQACRNANIHDFIAGLPEGYETIVGERGKRLSGGQRQRVSIARAFLKDAPILLLDEPTASVDVGTEGKIQEAVERISRGRTVIVIAHRLSTVQNANKTYVVSGGEIVSRKV